MAKRVFIVHRWYGGPGADWYPWLQRELERRGFAAAVLEMPTPRAPAIASWVDAIREAVGRPDADTYLVGHSVGCQAIMRYLESLPGTAMVGGAVLVAGWFSLTPASAPTAREQAVISPWLSTPIDFGRVRRHAWELVAILSDDDPYVPFGENERAFRRLGARIMAVKGGKHFDDDAGAFELPIALDAVLALARR